MVLKFWRDLSNEILTRDNHLSKLSILNSFSINSTYPVPSAMLPRNVNIFVIIDATSNCAVNSSKNPIISDAKSFPSVNILYRRDKSEFGLPVLSSITGRTLISVRDGEISCIHALSNFLSSEPNRLLSNDTDDLNIPLVYPASLISNSTLI